MLGPRELRRGADRLSTARAGSTGRHLETGANPLLMRNGKGVAPAFLGGACCAFGDSCGHSERPGRDADDVLEVAGEPALVREAGAGGDLRRGQAGSWLRELLGPLDAAQDDVPVRRHSGGGIAMPREAVAVVRDCGQLRQGKAG
jgi:hypothetical protein